jgi:hypothetical protein
MKNDIIPEKTFIRDSHRFDSIFTDRINTFIGIVKDNGLYQHWCDISTVEILYSLGHPKLKRTEESPIRILDWT